MRGLKWALGAPAAAVLLTIAAGLAGCKGFWDPLPSSGTGGTGAASGVFYILNSGQSQVAGFSFASGSTTPTAITNGSATFQARPLAMAIAPGGGFLYVSTGGGIFAYSIGSGGVLTLLNSNAVISSDIPTSMAVDSTGTWLVEATSGSGVLSAIPISSSTGLVDSSRTEQTVTLPGTDASVNQIAVSPSSATAPYVYVAMGTGGTAAIAFTTANTNPFGSVGTLAVKNASGGATAVAVDPSNRLLYVAETVAITGTNVTQTGGLRVFTIGSSSLNEVSGSPYATGGTGPSAILATANYVYIANQAVSGSKTGNISGYPVSSTGGVYSLGTLINTVTAGTTTVGLAEDSTSTYVLAVNSGGSPDLDTYTFDATTSGKLDAGATAATGTDPAQATAIVAVP